ncbi:snRNA-activating protein complex subunit 5 isoform X1 [Camelus dromedarius]|uniref:snRNA-activating protein complex subunit 5 isoform X1 n=3 Tax=Camelus TaxID=9836 RepID=A0A8B8T478_CAMFR|nr:snRNA-activating protein complex subunit 5 isoform X1 [Camelus dromedarius]XP_032336798.1 snRNA-activating protein complex subunit 5 isoform X1 [Camelus ferus]
MLSRLQELRKEEETLLRLKAALHDQLNRLKVEELALQSMISSRRGDEMLTSQAAPEQSHDQMLVHVDNEASINQTALELSTRSHVPQEEEEEEEEEESDS